MKARHKKILKQTKGYYGARSRTFRAAQAAVLRAGSYAYRDRKQKKRSFRALWIIRINAGVRQYGMTYSRFIFGLLKSNIVIDRKVLAHIAVTDSDTFGELVSRSKQSLDSYAIGSKSDIKDLNS